MEYRTFSFFTIVIAIAIATVCGIVEKRKGCFRARAEFFAIIIFCTIAEFIGYHAMSWIARTTVLFAWKIAVSIAR